MSDELPLEEQLRIARRLLARLDLELFQALAEVPECKDLDLDPITSMDMGRIRVRMRIPTALLPLEARLKQVIKQAVVKTLPGDPIAQVVTVHIQSLRPSA